MELKNNIQEWLDLTKDKIDSVRVTLSWAEDKYNQIKNWVEWVKTFIEENSWTIDMIQDTIQVITDTGTINN